ncbi:MAG: Spy/CpxP family protein refolding chaperone [Cyanobacteria bacterium P01_F01_bin.153]
MFNRKFPLIAAGSLLAGATLAYLPHLGLGLDATANSTAGGAPIESAEPTYLAQGEQRGPGEGRGPQGRRGGPGWLRDLNLTDAQKTEMRAIKEKYRPQFEEIRAEGKAIKDQMRQLISNPNTSDDQLRSQHQKVQQIRQSAGTLKFESMLEMRKILTPEQREQMGQRMAEREERRGGRGGRARGGRRGGGFGEGPQGGEL